MPAATSLLLVSATVRDGGGVVITCVCSVVTVFGGPLLGGCNAGSDKPFAGEHNAEGWGRGRGRAGGNGGCHLTYVQREVGGEERLPGTELPAQQTCRW
jgi:hypothetical protein